MNLDSLSFALSQISYSVANLTKKNYKTSVQEISHLIAQHGAEADRHLFRCLFSHVDFSGDGKSSGKDFHQTQYLNQECSPLITKPNFVATLCYAVDNPLHHQKSLKPTPHLFSQLSKVLKLTRVQEVAFGIALLNSSNSDTRTYAAQYIKTKLPPLLNTYIDPESGGASEGGLTDIAIEVLHLILSHLTQSKSSQGVTQDQKQSFLDKLQVEFPPERVPVVLAPLLYPEGKDFSLESLNTNPAHSVPKSIMESSLADIILELGYTFTSSVEECRSSLVRFGARELTPIAVAKALSAMAKTPQGLSDHIAVQNLGSSGGQWGADGKDKTDQAPPTWNMDIFVQVLKDVAPHLKWKEVVNELDHPGFIISTKAGLRLLMMALHRGLQEVFPIELVYKQWKNTEGQLSWINQALANPDVFCLADCPYHAVIIDILKSPPDEENRDIVTWKSIDLVETLLRLSEAGHYQAVSELFKFPHQNCPDMLVLALLQIGTWNTLKHDLLSSLMPIFLDNHANSAIVLHYAWHCQGQSSTIRTLVMHAMAEWYMRGEHHDQGRLSRILDVAQDLKALSMLLNATPFAFVIDLACLASRREYLKLEKWLSDKIREHGEPFIQACVHFLKRRCPNLLQGAKEDVSLQVKSQQLQPDTLNTMLGCLQACASSVSQELHEAIMTMLMNKARQSIQQPGAPPAPGVVGPNPPKAPVGPPTPASSNMPNVPGIPPPNPASQSNPMPPNPLSRMSMMQGMGQLPTGPPAPNSSPLSQGLPASLASSLNTTTGSPAKSFPPLGNPASSQPSGAVGQGFNPIQSLTSQLQASLPNIAGLGLEPPIGSVGNSGGSGGGLGSVASGMPGGLGGITSGIGTGIVGGSGPSLSSLSAQAAALKQPGSNPAPGSVPGQAARPSSQAGGANPGAPGANPATPGSGDVSSIFPAVNQQFSKEIEDEANSYFQRIYNHPPHPTNISIDEVLEMLKRFKDSPVKKEREVFACMLRNLFEEYRFFPQYPDRELQTTAVLFGGIIEQGLVTYMDLGIALRYVLEAFKKMHSSKMYVFGIAALDRFKTRLKDYPQYCQHLASIPHFTQFPAHLREYVEYGARSQEPPNRPQGPVVSNSSTPVTSTPASAQPSASTTTTTVSSSTPATTTTASHGAIARPSGAAISKPSIATATNIDTLLAGQENANQEISVPPEAVQDKVFFIFNNLSLANMDQKAKEMMECLQDEFRSWLAQYLVMKRASIEHNFHTLYAKFIDYLKLPEFLLSTVKETYRNIRVLLRSDKGVANFSDRSLLKNLGHWLGMLTLAKNKPILHNDIDLKSLLYEAYHKGSQELLYVVPFVAKVLESCAVSKVFKPPNPWTMAMMNVLAELHTEPELKLNLKFEIEVLCKNLNLDVNYDFQDLTPGRYLHDLDRLNRIEHQLSAPKKQPDSSTPQPDEPLQINMPTPTTTMMTSTPTTATSTTAATTGGIVAPQPQFGYHEINVMSFAGMAPHISVNEQLALFQAHPQLKQLVRPALERSVQEFLPPVVERSIKIALTTCEQIVKKDFALDPEESRMRSAAHHMVRFMTAGMALITCREPLLVSINTNIKAALLATLRGATVAQKESIEQAAQVLANENVELACAFIQKTAVEKAIPEMDKRLATEYELRKHARSDGRRYCDPVVLTYQAERMPEQIRLKVGGVTHQQIAVYEEFARNIPGFTPAAQEASGSGPYRQAQAGGGGFATDEITDIYNKLAREIDNHIHTVMVPPSNPQVVALHKLLEAVIVARNSREVVTALALLTKAVEGLLDGLTALPADHELMLRYRDCHLLVLRALQDVRAYGPQWTNKNVTRCLIECREEYKYNIEAVDCLIRSRLVHMQQYDVHLAQSMENGLNYMAVAFAMQLVQRFCVDENKSATQEADFFNTTETLARIAAHSRQAPEGLTALIDTIRQQHDGGLLDRAHGGPTSMMHSGISQAREFDDPPGLHEKTEFLLREWVQMYHSPAAGRDSTKAFSAFVGQMHQQGILKTDDLITRFFRLCTEMCVDLCYRALSETSTSPTLVRAKCFHTLDAFVRLIALLVKHSGDTSNTVTKINLLNKVLGIVAGVLLQDHEVRHNEFQQLPYHRIFIMLFIELNAPEHVLESINFQVLTAFCNTLHILRPAKAPGFAYAWLELVSHRVFIGRMLAITPQQRGWSMYAQLLIDLFKFLGPFLRNAELTKPMQLLYKGTLRVLLVLLHDFPEFLCDYHYPFCDVIPPNCIQVRNLILSAYPRQMRLPDPFTPNLKVDMLQEISHPPRIMTNFANMITPASFKKDLDSYIKTRSPVTFLSELRSNLQVSNEPGMRYNIPLIHALVLYVGTQAISYIHSKGHTPSMSTIAHSAHMDIFQNLAVDLDTEGRYLFLNAITNQLRYPNSHTHYFSCTLLYLFVEANTEAIQEQITRVLLERLIVNRPHPWGLLITFIELLKNPQFKFWNHEFVHCAPEIEKLFECVGRTFLQPRSVNNIRENEVPTASLA